MPGDSPVTRLLRAWNEGDQDARDRLVPLVYAELQKMAAVYLRRESAGLTLQPTALVHEAWLRLSGDPDPGFNSRAHFFGVAARLMRQILVDRARARRTAKRSAGFRIDFDEELGFTGERAAIVVAVHDALLDLEKQDPEKARIVELRYFGGMTAEDSAELLGISVHKVNRQMRLAQAWLQRELDWNSQRSAPENTGNPA